MPSKSDIQFGKIAVANSFATRDQVEAALKLQYRFEKKKSKTAVLEPFLLQGAGMDVARLKAIQDKMRRRVIFCTKCSSKFNIAQFNGGERFLCNKCNTRIEVPNFSSYSDWLKNYAGSIDNFIKEEEAVSAGPSMPSIEAEVERGDKATVVIKKTDVEKAAGDRPPADGFDIEDLPADSAGAARPAKDVTAAAETLDGGVIELEDAGELEECGKEEAEPAAKEKAQKAGPAAQGHGPGKSAKDIAAKIKADKKAQSPKPEPPQAGADLVYSLDGSILSFTGGDEASFLAKAPEVIEKLFAASKPCMIKISGFKGATRDCIKKLRDLHAKTGGKAKVRLELTAEQEKLAGSMTRKTFDLKVV